MVYPFDLEARDKLFSLIRNSELDALKEFLKESPSLLNIRSFSGTALSEAICHDSPEAVKILLDAGARPLGDESLGNVFLSTLEVAAAHGNLETMRLLLTQLKATSPTGIVIHSYNESQLMQKAMFAAAAHGNASIVAEFLDMCHCSDEAIEGTFLAAAGRWEADVIELLFQKAPGPLKSQSILTRALRQAMTGKRLRSDEEGSGVVYFDSDWDKHYRVVTRLLDETGIDVRLPEHGPPFLHQALARLEMQGALRALLDRGIDPNTRFENGCTPLHLLASPQSTYEITKEDEEEMHELGIRVLCEKGASITIRNNDGETPSHWAAEMADTAVFARHYLPADDDHLLSTNQYGETMLHFAAAGGKQKTVELLRSSRKFDVNAVNSTSWTPLLCALAPNSRVRKTEIEAVNTTRLLLHYRANPQIVTAEGLTILHLLGGHADLSEWKVEEIDDDGDDDGDSNSRKDQEVDVRACGAATLAKELFSGSWGLPPIQSPATIPRTSDYGDVWGGRFSQLVKSLSEKSPSDGDINAAHNRSPLHVAAERGAAGVARVLRELGGADDDAEDSNGKIPWDLAHTSRFMSGAVQEATKKAVQ